MGREYTPEELRKEEWRPLVDYPGYSVSSLGRVRSDQRLLWNGKGWYLSKAIILKPRLGANGYYQLDLKIKNERYPKRVHRLVADAFIPNLFDYPQVNHRNGIKTDNRAENLEWCTNSLNQLHAYARGLHHIKRNVWETRTRFKVPVVRISLDGTTRERFDSIAEAVRALGEGRKSTLYHVIKGANKTNIYKGYRYELAV